MSDFNGFKILFTTRTPGHQPIPKTPIMTVLWDGAGKRIAFTSAR